MNTNYQLGITQNFDCNYLPDKKERLLVAMDERLQNSDRYAWLMSQGFRRSGEQIYRPHCENCHACQSLRVLVANFSPSKSQKRLLKKNQKYQVKISHQLREEYYKLYELYINQVHSDGSMYPANFEQYQTFLSSKLTEQVFIEVWHDQTLISVAVTDVLIDALSAVYTFYHPDYRRNGIGVFSILKQVSFANEINKDFLYLGYQIDNCTKMNYKNRYYPHQILKENSWQTVNK